MPKRFPGAIALVSACLAGCAAPTAPSYQTSVEVAPLSGAQPSLAIARTADTLGISWWIQTPYPCYDFLATAAPQVDTLVATVEATAQDLPCAAVTAAFSYRLTVVHLPNGLHQLRLVHHYRGWPGDTAITVAIRTL